MARLGVRVASLGVVVGLVALVIPTLPVAVEMGRAGGLSSPQAIAGKALSRGAVLQSYGRFPLSFEVNRGQADPRVKFLARGRGYTLFLTARETVMVFSGAQDAEGARQGAVGTVRRMGQGGRAARSQTVVRMKLAGVNRAAQAAGRAELPGKVNYFIGNDPGKWRINIPTYAQVHYRGVYPGVDLVYYGVQGALEYDFVVAPRADPGVIRLSYEGVQKLAVDAQGDLVLYTPGGQIHQRKPLIYQEVAGGRKIIAGGYVLMSAKSVSVQVGAYDSRRPLVIDPVLSYSTFLGGGNDVANAIAVDSRRNAYVAGGTSSTNFPVTPGAYQTIFAGNSDAFVTKINATGSALIYSTYLGGSMPTGNSFSEAQAIAIDGSGNAYVTGQTTSTNFPTTPGAFRTTYGMGISHAFVTKLNASGSALGYSTYLGGNNVSSQDFGRGIAVDGSGNAYVTGRTDSTNFPTTPGAFQTTNGGGFDAFVTKLNADGSGLTYSTYLGGSGQDGGRGIAVDGSGNAYVAGFTGSTNFPTTTGAFQTTNGGGVSDVFVTKLNANGSGLVYSTYLGGSDEDVGNAIAVDTIGNAYVTGCTRSTNFPTTMGAFQTSLGGFTGPNCAALSGAGDAFVTKLNSTGTALIYSTYLGGNDNDSGFGIAVDAKGNAYVTGRTDSTNFPTLNALQPNTAGMSDAFVAKISATGSLVYSTYLGGSLFDAGLAIAVDASKNVYVVGVTLSGNFPTRNPLQLNLAGSQNAFVTRLSPVQKVGLYNPATATFYARRTNTTGTADISVTYGPANAGWFPLVGDWTGQGMQTIGLYDPTTATFYLRNSNSTGQADIIFTYGPAQVGCPNPSCWIPLVGDWTGSGVQTIGLYDPSTARFLLRNSNTSGTADITFTYGPANLGWFPLVGDWTGQGVQTVGLYDPTTARFYLRNSNSTGQADTIFTYGTANMGWFPLVGDWTGLGVQTIGLFNAVTATYYLRNSNTTGQADILVNFGPGGPPTPPWLPGETNWDGL